MPEHLERLVAAVNARACFDCDAFGLHGACADRQGGSCCCGIPFDDTEPLPELGELQ